MADQIAETIIKVALDTRLTHPQAPALDVLDLAMVGRHGADLDMEARGGVFADWLDPPSPFAKLLHHAFAPDLPLEPLFAGDDSWHGQVHQSRLLVDLWQERVVDQFAARYGLWEQG